MNMIDFGSGFIWHDRLENMEKTLVEINGLVVHGSKSFPVEQTADLGIFLIFGWMLTIISLKLTKKGRNI